MATIQLNNNDLRTMIRETVSRLCEGSWYEAEAICRNPYFVMLRFSEHAIDREFQRSISEEDVIEDAKKAIGKIIEDYGMGIIAPGERIKIIDRDRCRVSVCRVNPGYGKKRVGSLDVVTSFIWDGRVNIETGNFYYVNPPSIDFKEAQEWNENNQDKVKSYKEWKHDYDLANLAKKADRVYDQRKKDEEPGRKKRLDRLTWGYNQKMHDDKQAIHDSLPDGDLKTIQDYFKDMDSRRIKLEPLDADELYEMVNRATQRVIREALRKLPDTGAIC